LAQPGTPVLNLVGAGVRRTLCRGRTRAVLPGALAGPGPGAHLDAQDGQAEWPGWGRRTRSRRRPDPPPDADAALEAGEPRVLRAVLFGDVGDLPQRDRVGEAAGMCGWIANVSMSRRTIAPFAGILVQVMMVPNVVGSLQPGCIGLATGDAHTGETGGGRKTEHHVPAGSVDAWSNGSVRARSEGKVRAAWPDPPPHRAYRFVSYHKNPLLIEF
jgi:hypothetical protein